MQESGDQSADVGKTVKSRERTEEDDKIKAIQEKVDRFERKRDRLARKELAIKAAKQRKREEEELSHKLLQCLTCQLFCKKESAAEAKERRRKEGIADRAGGDPKIEDELEKDYQLKKLLNRKNDEQESIRVAQEKWGIIRKKIKAIRAMGKLGGQTVLMMIERSQANQEKSNQNNKLDDSPDPEPSKFIIPPRSYWNMQWNNLTQLVFIVWILYAPLVICTDTKLDDEAIGYLLVFDILFMLDRVADLFVGHQKQDGTEETRLYNVIYSNVSSKIFIEIIVGFGPYMVGIEEMHTLAYFAFKVLRCSRLFEMDNQINEIIEYYGQTATRAET